MSDGNGDNEPVLVDVYLPDGYMSGKDIDRLCDRLAEFGYDTNIITGRGLGVVCDDMLYGQRIVTETELIVIRELAIIKGKTS